LGWPEPVRTRLPSIERIGQNFGSGMAAAPNASSLLITAMAAAATVRASDMEDRATKSASRSPCVTCRRDFGGDVIATRCLEVFGEFLAQQGVR
jgi:hypothetical protein